MSFFNFRGVVIASEFIVYVSVLLTDFKFALIIGDIFSFDICQKTNAHWNFLSFLLKEHILTYNVDGDFSSCVLNMQLV